jgi:hypothetical protein
MLFANISYFFLCRIIEVHYLFLCFLDFDSGLQISLLHTSLSMIPILLFAVFLIFNYLTSMGEEVYFQVRYFVWSLRKATDLFVYTHVTSIWCFAMQVKTSEEYGPRLKEMIIVMVMG